jgi:hypothetical protein
MYSASERWSALLLALLTLLLAGCMQLLRGVASPTDLVVSLGHPSLFQRSHLHANPNSKPPGRGYRDATSARPGG